MSNALAQLVTRHREAHTRMVKANARLIQAMGRAAHYPGELQEAQEKLAVATNREAIARQAMLSKQAELFNKLKEEYDVKSRLVIHSIQDTTSYQSADKSERRAELLHLQATNQNAGGSNSRTQDEAERRRKS